MKMKIPRYWLEDTERFGTEMMEVETIKGQKVMIPKKFSTYWENVKITVDGQISVGLDPQECFREASYPLVSILAEIYLGIFEEKN